MRLVDGDQREIGAGDEAAKGVAGRALGSYVEQVELAVVEALNGSVAIRVGGGQRRGTKADRVGAADLVVHQRDQRGDDERSAVARDRRKLVAKRLPRAGRHDGKRMLPGEHPIDDVLLNAAEMVEAEDAFEKVVRSGHV